MLTDSSLPVLALGAYARGKVREHRHDLSHQLGVEYQLGVESSCIIMQLDSQDHNNPFC